jgi:hypothetical protein
MTGVGSRVYRLNCQTIEYRSSFAIVSDYLLGVLGNIDAVRAPAHYEVFSADTAERAFGVITKREFCYLSRGRAEAYRAEFLRCLAPHVERRLPLRFFYDVGGGYHASIEEGGGLGFHVGLAELMVLNQIASFDKKIREFYSPGVQFSLVVDNLCALLVNDIRLECTEGYVRELRALIERLGIGDTVDLLVESENFTESDYRDNAPPVEPVVEVSPKDLENVCRFLGRRCSVDEAQHRMALYKAVTQISEERLSSKVDGVHMTQRATPSTFGFRAFPGGDSRIQAGRVGLIRDEDAKKIRPVLITSRNSFTICSAVETRTRVSDLIGPVLLVANGTA